MNPDLVPEVKTYTYCPRCPHCATALFAIRRDQPFAQLPAMPEGWRVVKHHDPDRLWASIMYKYGAYPGSTLTMIITVYIPGDYPTYGDNQQRDEVDPQRVSITYRCWSGPPG